MAMPLEPGEQLLAHFFDTRAVNGLLTVLRMENNNVTCSHNITRVELASGTTFEAYLIREQSMYLIPGRLHAVRTIGLEGVCSFEVPDTFVSVKGLREICLGINLPIQLRAKERTTRATTVDLTENGCGVMLSESELRTLGLRKGDRLSIGLALPRGTIVMGEAELSHVLGTGDPTVVELRFVKLADSDQNSIGRALLELWHQTRGLRNE